MTHLKLGDLAPNFKGITEKGEIIKRSHFRGKRLVLFFYPQDNTPTCTIEACNLRDNYELLLEKGYAVVGVSPDGVRKHQNFINKFDLPYSLIADTDRKIIEAYGVWGPKKFMGREFDGVHRTTFIIGRRGRIEDIIEKVKSKSHAEQILERKKR